MQKAITLFNQQAALGHEVVSLEADFDKMTWTFRIDDDTTVAAGRYFLVHESELLDASRRASGSGSET